MATKTEGEREVPDSASASPNFMGKRSVRLVYRHEDGSIRQKALDAGRSAVLTVRLVGVSGSATNGARCE